MANDAGKIVVGANGRVLVAPVGTAAPTHAGDTLNAAFEELGFVSENGVLIQPSQSITPVMVWQSAYSVRRIVTSRGLEIDFTLREFNAESLPFAFGGGTLTPISGSQFKYTPPAPEDIDARALVVEWEDGDKNYRLYIPDGQVTDLSQFTVSRTAPSELPIKFALNHDGTGDPFNIFSDDPGLGS